MSSWLYDPVADLAFQSDDPPGTSPLRASRLTRFTYLPTTSGLQRTTVKASCYAAEFGGLKDPVQYWPLGEPVNVGALLADALDQTWAAIPVARGCLAIPNGAGR